MASCGNRPELDSRSQTHPHLKRLINNQPPVIIRRRTTWQQAEILSKNGEPVKNSAEISREYVESSDEEDAKKEELIDELPQWMGRVFPPKNEEKGANFALKSKSLRGFNSGKDSDDRDDLNTGQKEEDRAQLQPHYVYGYR